MSIIENVKITELGRIIINGVEYDVKNMRIELKMVSLEDK